jgi:hypothetical protein
MKKPLHLVEIERVVLTGFDVAPYRAERIRALIERNLQDLLQQGRWPEPDGLKSSEVSRLQGPQMHLSQPENDVHLASGVAASIAETINGLNGA